jgi:adenosine kinase
MKHTSHFNFDDVDSGETIAIVAPGNVDDMINYSRSCKDRGIDFIFDPGQSLPMWNGGTLAESLEGSRILISNDYELEMIINCTGLNRNSLLKRTGAIVTTLGEAGSRVSTVNDEINIPAVEPREVVDPTGAGDAYRAGLVKGIIQGRNILESAKMGSVCASFAVEHYGTQEYSFTQDEFDARLNKYLSQ